MVFGAFLWILILFIPLQTSPEFVVHEIRACCHHQISLRCKDQHSKIAIVQARYINDEVQESIAAVINPLASSPTFLSSQTYHSQQTVSLWDLDIKFANDFMKDNIKPPLPVNTLPEWHADHSSHFERRRKFLYPKVTIPPKFPIGVNFSSERIIEMPLYEMDFLDKETIWKQALFPVVQTSTEDTGSLHYNLDETFSTAPSLPSNNKCLSYQTLMNDARPSSFPEPSTKSSEEGKPSWHFNDLRPYFNKRCSGKSECDVYLLRNKERDQDLTRVCQIVPGGRIIVKYLCYNSTSDDAHSKCNVDVKPAREGFLMNPGYPDLYPGDQPCQWRLHVPLQKMLLIFFDISLRGQDKAKCRDELVVTDEPHIKLLSTCGDHSSAIALLSETHQLNVTLTPQSRLAFPKRGFLAYYRVIGCMDPEGPSFSYMVFRNATHAYFTCDVGHIFPDTLTRDRWLFCSPLDHSWVGDFPYCQDIRNLMERNSSIDELLLNDPSVWPVKHRNTKQDMFYDFGIPLIVIAVIFLLHGIVLYFIWRQRNRLEEIENQTNQEREQICHGAADSPEEVSIFSFPDSMGDDLWDDDDGLDQEETDFDRTLTTLTLQTDTPTSSAARKVSESHPFDEQRNGNGHFRFFQNGTTANNNGNGQGPNGRPHVGYVNGNLLPSTFQGYFRTTAV